MTRAGPALTCFVEHDPEFPLARRALAEMIGTALLMLVATASGLASGNLFSGVPGLSVLASAVGVAAALSGLIVALGAVSGGHFNPLITGLQWLSGQRSRTCTLAYILAQFAGAVIGALIARALYDGAGVSSVGTPWRLGLSELLATFGLMVVVFGCSRSAKAATGPFAVGGWVAAAFIATPSRCYANPALVVGAIFAAGPVALSPYRAMAFVAADLVGALGALAAIAVLYPLNTGKAMT